MLKAKTELENFCIKVDISDLIRVLFNLKSSFSPAIVNNHHSELDKVRHEGFRDKYRAERTRKFLLNNGYSSCNQIKSLIHENQENVIEAINKSYKGKFMLLLILPFLIMAICQFVFGRLFLGTLCVLLLLISFAGYVNFYLSILEHIAHLYYEDGILRLILKDIDKRCQHKITYDLSIPLI